MQGVEGMEDGAKDPVVAAALAMAAVCAAATAKTRALRLYTCTAPTHSNR